MNLARLLAYVPPIIVRLRIPSSEVGQPCGRRGASSRARRGGQVIKWCRDRNIVCLPGCATPTELYQVGTCARGRGGDGRTGTGEGTCARGRGRGRAHRSRPAVLLVGPPGAAPAHMAPAPTGARHVSARAGPAGAGRAEHGREGGQRRRTTEGRDGGARAGVRRLFTAGGRGGYAGGRERGAGAGRLAEGP